MSSQSALVYQYGTPFDTAKKPSGSTLSGYKRQYRSQPSSTASHIYSTPAPTLSDNIASLRDDVARLSGKAPRATPQQYASSSNVMRTPSRSKDSLYYDDYSEAQSRLEASTPFLKSIQKARASLSTPDRRRVFLDPSESSRAYPREKELADASHLSISYRPLQQTLNTPVHEHVYNHLPTHEEEDDELPLTQAQIHKIYRHMKEEPSHTPYNEHSRTWTAPINHPTSVSAREVPGASMGADDLSLGDVQSQLKRVTHALEQLQVKKTSADANEAAERAKRQERDVVVGMGISRAQRHIKRAMKLAHGLDGAQETGRAGSTGSRGVARGGDGDSDSGAGGRRVYSGVAYGTDEDNVDINRYSDGEGAYVEDASDSDHADDHDDHDDEEERGRHEQGRGQEKRGLSTSGSSRTRTGAGRAKKSHKGSSSTRTKSRSKKNLVPSYHATSPSAFYPDYPSEQQQLQSSPRSSQHYQLQQQQPYHHQASQQHQQRPMQHYPQSSDYQSNYGVTYTYPPPEPSPTAPTTVSTTASADAEVGVALSDLTIDNNILKRHLQEERERNKQMVSQLDTVMQRADAQALELRKYQQEWEEKESSWRGVIAEKEQALHILRLSLAKREAEWAHTQLTAGDRTAEEGARKGLEAEVKALKDYTSSLTQQLAQAKLSHSISEKQLQETTEKLERLSAMKQAMSSELHKISEESLSLQRQLQDMTYKKRESEEIVETLRREVRGFLQEKQENDVFLSDLKGKLRETQSELGMLKSDREGMVRTEQVLKDKCSQLEGLIVEIRTKLVYCEEQLQEERQKRKNAEVKGIDDVANSTSKYETRIQLIENERNTLETTLHRMKREYMDIEEKVKDRELTIGKLRSELLNRENQEKTLMSEIRRKEEEYRDESSELRRKIKEIQTKLIESEGRAQMLQQRVEDMKQEHHKDGKTQEDRYLREIELVRQERERERMQWSEEQHKMEDYFTTMLADVKREHQAHIEELEARWRQRVQESVMEVKEEGKHRQESMLEHLRVEYEAKEQHIRAGKDQEREMTVKKMEKEMNSRIEKLMRKHDQEKQLLLSRLESQLQDVHSRAATETAQLHQLLQKKDLEIDSLLSRQQKYVQEQHQAQQMAISLRRAEERVMELEQALEEAQRRHYVSEQQALSPIRGGRVITLGGNGAGGVSAAGDGAVTPRSNQPSPSLHAMSPDILGRLDEDLEQLLGYASPEQDTNTAIENRRRLEEKRRKGNEVLRSLEEEMNRTSGKQGLMGEIDACARKIEYMTPKKENSGRL